MGFFFRFVLCFLLNKQESGWHARQKPTDPFASPLPTLTLTLTPTPGPAFLRVLDEADGCDEDAVGFVKSVVSRFCFLDGDVRLPVGAADLGGGAGKIKKGLSVLREALSSEEEAKGWEKAVRLGGGVLRALVSLVVTDDAKLTASGVPEAAVYVLSELAGRNPRPAVAFIAPNASILLKRATEMLPKLRTALSEEREQLNAEHRKAFDAELQFTGDPTTRAAIVRKRELSLDRVLGAFRVCCMCMLYADKASLKAFARDRTLVRSLAASVCDYTEFPYPELSGLLPKLLVLLDQIDVSKSALEQCVTHRNRAAVSEAIARCFNKPEKDIELHVVRFVMEVYDSGNERFFAASDQKCLFQILISHLESLEYELGDAVLLALIECYRAMVEWEGYSQERFYHEEGEAQIETVLSNITRSSNLDYTREGSPAHTLYVKALQVSQLLKSL